MDLADLGSRGGEWLKGAGPEPDVVMSSRVRLARNLAGYPFPPRATEEQRGEVLARVRTEVEKLSLGERTWFVEVTGAASLETRFLVERHLISRELASGKGPRGVAFGSDERVSVMVNEEDHVRLQTIRSGASLDEAFEDARRADQSLEEELTFAVSPSYGYLTACPTNVGTGLRASVMLHLPALVYGKQIEKVFQSASQTQMAVRGFYGEGTMASGDFYQISNQASLGRSEEDILGDLKRMIPHFLAYEREMRKHLMRKGRLRLEDKVHRALAILRNARAVTSEEAMEFLSAVRLGVVLGLLSSPSLETVNGLFLWTQPAHLQRLAGKELDADDRDVRRAVLLRERLAA